MTTADVDRYLAGQTEEKRAALQHLRETIRELAPDAEEGLSYGIPAFLIGGKPIAGYAAFKAHLSYFPHSGSVITALADELTDYATAKGTIRFAVDDPLPRDLVAKLIATRRTELG